MVEAGCDAIFDLTGHAAMLLSAVRAAGRAIAMLQTAERHLRRYPFDAAVVIDSPTLHLPLAARAQAVGVPVMYYIAPQMWAWGAYRIHKLRNRVDRVAVILPFEEKYFRDRGVNATYVGHPLAEHFVDPSLDNAVISGIRSEGTPVVALLPGSRRHVVQAVLPGQLEVAWAIADAIPGARFGVSIANPGAASVFNQCMRRFRPPIRPIAGRQTACETALIGRTYSEHHSELIAAADLVLVASGTSTLEVAFHRRPMIVMYNASRLFYQLIGRWMIHTPYLALPNILAGREIVPEFMPYYTSTRPIAERAIELLESEEARRTMIRDLVKVVEPLRSGRASERAAAMLLDMVSRSRH